MFYDRARFVKENVISLADQIHGNHTGTGQDCKVDVVKLSNS